MLRRSAPGPHGWTKFAASWCAPSSHPWQGLGRVIASEDCYSVTPIPATGLNSELSTPTMAARYVDRPRFRRVGLMPIRLTNPSPPMEAAPAVTTPGYTAAWFNPTAPKTLFYSGPPDLSSKRLRFWLWLRSHNLTLFVGLMLSNLMPKPPSLPQCQKRGER